MTQHVWTLHYDGMAHVINIDEARRLQEWKGESHVVEVSKGQGEWVQIALGPGIPFSITRKPAPDKVEREIVIAEGP